MLCRGFKDALIRECRKKGMKVSDPEVQHVPFARMEDFFKGCRESYPKMRVFVMYMDSRDDSHGKIYFEADLFLKW